jgi:hypothetical protein
MLDTDINRPTQLTIDKVTAPAKLTVTARYLQPSNISGQLKPRYESSDVQQHGSNQN